jgi:UDP-N-acetylmuramate--alanine ligase
MSHYHLIGIGGTGLSAIARLLIELGHQVSGSDMVVSPLAKDLRKIGVKVYEGHAADQVTGADLIIRSSAIPDENPEVIAGLKTHIPVVKRIEFLDKLTNGKKVIAIAGTHGKTTTTAMCAWVFHTLNLDPSYIIGGVSKNLGVNAHAGEGAFFVIEADEYDRMFLGLQPDILVLTTIEHDHPDFYPTESLYFDAFRDLTRQIKQGGTIIACKDDPGVMKIISAVGKEREVHTYGTSSDSDYKISDLTHKANHGVSFVVGSDLFKAQGKHQYQVDMILPGRHIALNAAAAISVSSECGLSIDNACRTLEMFSGTGRRFDILGAAAGVIIIDDYAHHPTEIQATIAAARSKYPDQQIWTVWQPHTYSRTKTLFDDFAASFKNSDHVIVSEIYASREKKETYSSISVVEAMGHKDARYIKKLDDIITFLSGELKSGDVLLVLSAGDANRVSRSVYENLMEREVKRA